MRIYHTRALGFLAGLLTISPLAYGQMVQDLPATKIIVYSNGTYFLKQEGKVQTSDNGEAIITFPQKPLKGSFWLKSSNKDAWVKQMNFGTRVIKRDYEAESMIELLQANIGAEVMLKVKSLDEKSSELIAGTLQKVVLPDGMGSSGLVFIKKGMVSSDRYTDMVIAMEDIQRFAASKDLKTRFFQDSVATVGTLMINKKGAQVGVELISLQQDMTWEPSFHFHLIGKQRAEIGLKGTITNATNYDFKGVNTSMVIGYPMISDGSLDAIIGQVMPTPVPRPVYKANRARTRALMAAPMVESAGRAPMAMDADMVEEAPPPPVMAGAQSGDFYFFDAGKVTLPAKNRSVVQIATSEVSYEDHYSISLPGPNIYVGNTPDEPYTLNANSTHYIKFENKLEYPIPDAICLVTDEKEQPVGQVRVPYIAKGDKGTIALSEGRDVRAVVTEFVKVNTPTTIEKKKYQKCRIKTTIKVTNYLPVEVKVKASRTFPGTILEKTAGKVNSPKSAYIYSINSFWEENDVFKAGESKTYTIEYEQYLYLGTEY